MRFRAPESAPPGGEPQHPYAPEDFGGFYRREYPAVVPTAPPASPTTVAPAGPTVTITPSTGLADGQVVHVVLKGCPPGGTYLAAECRGGLGDCLHQSGIADATGTVSIYLKMQKVISGVYCGIEGGCSFGVFRPEGNATSAFPLGYSYSNQHIWFGP